MGKESQPVGKPARGAPARAQAAEVSRVDCADVSRDDPNGVNGDPSTKDAALAEQAEASAQPEASAHAETSGRTEASASRERVERLVEDDPSLVPDGPSALLV